MYKKNLGQVFTPSFIVSKMINLITKKNPNLVLEPSSGTGNFYFELKKIYRNVVGIEIDKSIAHMESINKSYFDTNFKPDIIIGNPPYVDFKNIKNKPHTDLLIHKPNLYYFFIEKFVNDLKENGELILIVPSNIFTNTSAGKLIEKIYNQFSITYWEPIPENVWDNASVPTAIIKMVKTINHPNKINYFLNNQKIMFGKKLILGEKVEIKVGGASGFNSYLTFGDTEFVLSKTVKNKKTYFIKYEPRKWIRPVPKAPIKFSYQIFVNCKTREKEPFYMLNDTKKNSFINYDASVLCIYTFCSKHKSIKILNKLNKFDWKLAGVKKDGRFHFSQGLLKSIIE